MTLPAPIPAAELIQRLPAADDIRREIAEIDARRKALTTLLRAAIRAEKGCAAKQQELQRG